MYRYSVFIAYVGPMMHVGTCQEFVGMICSVPLDVQCSSAVQCSMQCIADMALHRRYCVISSAVAVQGESAMTKVTNLSH